MRRSDVLKVDIGGAEIAYRLSGVPDGAPIVLLHGMTADGSDWDPVIDGLGGDHRVYALDARGHGASDWTGNYSLELLRDDVLGVLDALSLDRVTLIGHSLGGTVAVLFAEQHPGRLAGLVVEDATVPSNRDQPPAPRERPNGPLGFDPRLIDGIGPQLRAPDPAWWSRLADISVPTLLLGGGLDSNIPQLRISEMAGLIPHARLVTIPAGHHIHRGRPVDFVAAIRQFDTDRGLTTPDHSQEPA